MLKRLLSRYSKQLKRAILSPVEKVFVNYAWPILTSKRAKGAVIVYSIFSSRRLILPFISSIFMPSLTIVIQEYPSYYNC